MVLQVRRAGDRRFRSICALTLAAAVAATACDKAPLLAPGGTVIFLNASAPSVSATGEVEIVAVLLEQGSTPTTGTGTGSGTTAGSGTPVHNGTLVSFTSNIGRIEPAEARTQNGRVTVRFIGDGRSGAATVLAYSGGARTEMTLNVGAAAAERVLVSATPVGSSGGASTVTAKVEDTSGNPLPGVAVQFSTTRGTLSAQSATTNAAGVATVTLTTTSEAVVTATAGTKSGTATVSPATRAAVTITPPATITASSPATFTFAAASTAGLQNIRVNWGDGEVQDLGPVASSQQQHTYAQSGPYTVTATAQMSDGSSETPISTGISVAAFTVTLSANINTPNRNQVVTFTATVSPNTTQVQRYRWDFGDGSDPVFTDGPSAQHAFDNTTGQPQNRTVTVTVIPVKGDTRQNSVIITVQST